MSCSRLHPAPAEDACDPQRESCLRHRLVCLSRALLDAAHPYRDPVLLEFRARFLELLRAGESSSRGHGGAGPAVGCAHAASR